MIYTELEKIVDSQVSKRRLEHCQSTAKQTASLVHRFCPTISPKDALIVGLWHDFARQWSNEELLKFCQEQNLKIEKEEEDDPMLLHGYVASLLLPKYFKECQKNWQDAIRWHTLGSVKMGVLGAALYIADYIEPLRSHLTKEERFAILRETSLEKMVLKIIKLHKLYLRSKKKIMAKTTENLYQFLLNKGVFSL